MNNNPSIATTGTATEGNSGISRTSPERGSYLANEGSYDEESYNGESFNEESVDK
jgi:hypothetical protein